MYTLRYYFDENRAPVGFGLQYPTTTYWENYYFAKNVQGDIIALYRSDYQNETTYTGTLIATYEYDPWGRPTSIKNASGVEIAQTASHIANYNPFRYRGYRYDADTGFYYLQSRYYDPEICRFINADGYAGTGQDFLGYNMFTYCGNNPIIRSDVAGEFWNVIIGAVVGAVVGAVSEIVSQTVNSIVTGERIDWGEVGVEAAGGAVHGAFFAATGSSALANFASAAVTTTARSIRDGDSFGEYAINLCKNTASAVAFPAVKSVANRFVSGKFAKLGKIGKVIKKLTEPAYEGVFLSNSVRTHTLNALSQSLPRGATNVVKSGGESLMKLFAQ